MAPSEKTHLLISGIIAVCVVQIVYLAVLSLSEVWLSFLPKAFYVVETDTNRLGDWAWQNMVRDAIPWNLPAVAVILHGIATALLLRSVPCKADKAAATKQDSTKRNDVVSLGELGGDAFGYFFPIALFLLVLFLAVGLPKNGSLTGKTITIFSPDGVAQSVPKYDAPGENGFGLLPVFIETLGGKVEYTKDFNDEDLKRTDVLVILDSKDALKWPKDYLSRIWQYVLYGGTLLVPGSQPIAAASNNEASDIFMCVCEISAQVGKIAPAASEWEQSQAGFAHSATLGSDVSDFAVRFNARFAALYSVVRNARLRRALGTLQQKHKL